MKNPDTLLQAHKTSAMRCCYLLFPILMTLHSPLHAQPDSLSSLQLSAYVDVYYSYDFNRPANNSRPAFIYNHHRHNEVNLNLAFVKAAWQQRRVRANLALMAGTYANANLAGEPGVLRNVFEANAGIKLHPKKNLWIDAGIFASHIGFESAISKDCWTLTRSILAENSPYYEAGAKLTYQTDDGKWLLSGLVLNGWQRITRVDGSTLPAFGTQLQYRPNEKTLLNYSTFIGSNDPDSVRRMRYFHNLYGQWQLSSKTGLIIGFDWGLQQRSRGSQRYQQWFSPVLMLRQQLTEKWFVAGRLEYYSDPHEVMIGTASRRGFSTWGGSVNLDYQVLPQCIWRTEWKLYSSENAVFTKRVAEPVRQNMMAATAIAIQF